MEYVSREAGIGLKLSIASFGSNSKKIESNFLPIIVTKPNSRSNKLCDTIIGLNYVSLDLHHFSFFGSFFINY